MHKTLGFSMRTSKTLFRLGGSFALGADAAFVMMSTKSTTPASSHLTIKKSLLAGSSCVTMKSPVLK